MRPDLINAETIIPLTEKQQQAEEERRRAAEELAAAEMQIRRLANKHGCTRDPQTGEVTCPDPAAHARDVGAPGDLTGTAGMATVLEAGGLIPYQPGRPPKTPATSSKVITSYRRPGT